MVLAKRCPTMGVRVTWLLLVTTGILGFMGCHQKPISDIELRHSFLSNEIYFLNLAAIYKSGQVQCSGKSDVDTCILSSSQADPSHTSGRLHVQVAYIKKHHSADDGVWLPVQSYGTMSTSSSARGYVYLDHSPQMTVEDTLNVDKKGSFYKPLSEGWYIFTIQ